MADSTTTRNDFVEEIITNVNTAVVKTSEVVAKKRWAAISVADGKTENADDAANLMNVGYFIGEVQQRENKETGDGTIEWTIGSDVSLESEPVTGVTAATDIFQPVFPTDNSTLSITQPALGTPNGYVKRFRSSAVADIHVFKESDCVLWGYMGGNTRVIYLGTIFSALLEGTSKITYSDTLIENRCSVVNVYANKVRNDATTAAGAQNISLEKVVSGTPSAIATSQVALAHDDAQGAQKTLTAAIASNTLSRGDKLRLVLDASGTGFTAAKNDVYEVFAVIKNLPGA